MSEETTKKSAESEASGAANEGGAGQRADEADAAGAAGATSGAPETELADRLRKAEEERAFYLDELRRAKADFENYQRRVRREQPVIEQQAARRILARLLPFADNFERALESDDETSPAAFRDGIVMIHQLFRQFLEAQGVTEVSALDEPFDPQLHEAVHQVPAADESAHGKVVEVLQKGYRQGDALLRPASVVVGMRPDGR